MAKCQAGDCEVECAEGKGCGCAAESDHPENCSCFCSGGKTGGTLTLDPATLVDVTLNDLPLFEVATFLNSVQTESIIVPARRLNEHVTLSVKRKPFSHVLDELDLTTTESIERDRNNIALLKFIAGAAVGALVFSLFFRSRSG